MKNPYIKILSDYVGIWLNYKDEFCKILDIEPKQSKSKKEQLDFYRQYMELELGYGTILIKRFYEGKELEVYIKRQKFTDYFEYLLILYLNNITDDVAVFTYPELSEKMYMVNKNYRLAKSQHLRPEYIVDKEWKVSVNKWDNDKYEINNILNFHVNLYFTKVDRILSRIINSALASMEKRSLILCNKSFRLYKEVYNKDTKGYSTTCEDCTDEQVNEILDIQNRVREQYNIKDVRDLMSLSREERDEYRDEISKAVRNSKILNHSNYYGKILKINLAKRGLLIEADKINKLFNKQMLNSNVHNKLLTSNELKCIDDILREKMTIDLIDIYEVGG